MKTIDEIRRENILALQDIAGGAPRFAEKLGMSYAQYVNLRDGAKDSKTGKKRGMRPETARKFEMVTGKAEGWLDQDHSSLNTSPFDMKEEASGSTNYLRLAQRADAPSKTTDIVKRIYALPEDLLDGLEPHLITLEALAKARRNKENGD